jgi:hypothetical protein
MNWFTLGDKSEYTHVNNLDKESTQSSQFGSDRPCLFH